MKNAPGQVPGAFSFGRVMLPSVIILALVPAVDVRAAQPAGTSPLRDLIQLVRAIDVAGPLTPRKLASFLGPLRCQADSACAGGPVRLRSGTIGEVRYRRYDGGALLILDHLTGKCVPLAAMLTPGATLSPPVNGCTDGVICLYRAIQRPWGTLRLGVRDARASACVDSVVIERRD